MNIIGISAYFHDAACCLIKDGRLVAAAEEERFSRMKFDKRLPQSAFRYCLKAGGINITDVDCIAYYESPPKKLSRQLCYPPPLNADSRMSWLDSKKPEREIRTILGFDGPIDLFGHHQSHAASSYLFSGFKEAAILTTDAVGEWTTTSYGTGAGGQIELVDEVLFPDSIGLFYSAMTNYLGFKVLSGEYKVMGLAPYGEARFTKEIWELISVTQNGKFELNHKYFDFDSYDRMFTDDLIDLLKIPPRNPADAVAQIHKDIARSVQVVLEEVMLAQVAYLRKFTDSPNLCLSGGVALNCVANGRILREGSFTNLFVQPAAGDAGSALGAAALSHVKRTGSPLADVPLRHVYLGPSYSPKEVEQVTSATELQVEDFRDNEAGLLERIVDFIIQGKVIGWLHGRMEFGPRALGGRSILADPRDPGMRERLNALVKKREAFRPFAPIILEKYAQEHMNLDHDSPFMTETCQMKSKLSLPAITHVDGSCRPQTVNETQNPRIAKLLELFFRKTGCPILVNTSFNLRGEPIVCTPSDALKCFASSQIDILVLEDFVLEREPNASQLEIGSQLLSGESTKRLEDDQLGAIYTFI
jgi:carbamoyltransferase